jgi:hypothetical protein
MKYKAKELFPNDVRVSAKQVNTDYGDYFNWFKNCHHKPRRWLTTFILNYLYHCEVNQLESPTNYLLLEVANDTWGNISNHSFTIQDVNLVLNYLETKEFIVNQLGYGLPQSKPLGFLASFGKMLNTKII